MSELSQWGLFLLIGAGTFAIRLSFIEFYGCLRIPPLLRRALLYVPASVLAALVLPAVVYPDRQAAFDWSNPQIPAAILAGLAAWRTKSTLLTLVVGLGALWALKNLGA
ncbi:MULTISPECIES: AzlD domain-containing protein [unclassified Pseudomonas]|uniref:AzlD domain-containing protein n=1 Tax=unclassified Pseudomonas TaxID=196821 RepID=UPI0011A8DC1B|nr:MULTISPECIES: AzlD domain-containing protein [unclassified Pseudomonas]TWC22263.1 branched-subunit amino acid transport protein [Pseudomonas sp. SJZ083]TWC48752.1 branched-subunit amino acid transport protein [Pseudomonas sp. SJZ077]